MLFIYKASYTRNGNEKMYIYRFTHTGQIKFEDTLCMDKILGEHKKAIPSQNQLFTKVLVSVNSMLWKFQRNLMHETLGAGKIFSYKNDTIERYIL